MTQISIKRGPVKTVTLVARAAAALVLYAALGAGAAHAASTDADKVAQSMRAIWDQPDAPLSVGPIVVVEGYALAGWVQQARGGRALLVNHDGSWQVHICGGDGLKDMDALQMAGIKEATARRLVQAANEAEEKVPEETRRKFASFGENIMVDDTHAPR
ncbi:copper uptake system-associated protein [Castellaniella hirudinis]|uniref:Copper uptake system-associated protein n=1 Tax=Castellaniella hirudinis TaxID=1144617 RepID=A0ABV8RWL6_9BURK